MRSVNAKLFQGTQLLRRRLDLVQELRDAELVRSLGEHGLLGRQVVVVSGDNNVEDFVEVLVDHGKLRPG